MSTIECAKNEKVIKMRKSSEGVYQSGVKGITWEKNIDTWRASIRVNGEERIIGFNPNLYELIPLMEVARKKLSESTDAFNEWYKEVIGREKRVVTPCPFQSDVAGVSYLSKQNKWLAQVSIENRKYVLGTTPVQEDAEAMRHEAEKIKVECENTVNETGIIDYTPLYKHLENLRIEKQQSRLDARIGTGHGKRAWKRLKKEEHALDELIIKSMKGDIVKELKEYKKDKKAETTKALEEYPDIEYSKGTYYVFLNVNNKKTYIGKTTDIIQAILLYEMGNSKALADDWTNFYELEIDMGLKVPTIDELLSYFDLSNDKYKKMKKIASDASGLYTNYKKETFGEVTVMSKDFRHLPVSDKARLVFAGVSVVVKEGIKVPLNGFSIMLNPGEVSSLTNDMVDELYKFDEAVSHLTNGDFWYWYLFESGTFANMEDVE